MIQVEHLQKHFKKVNKKPGLVGSIQSLFNTKYDIVKAVDDISFHVPEGEILGFIGPNGAGKSTVIKMLTGILTPTSGSCRINGKDPQANRKKYVKEIGVVFGQRTQLWWDLPLRETYGVLKEIYEVDDASYTKRMAFLNEVLELESFITSPVRTLSLGQRMRADIAAALLHNPKVLFLDEPTIGLDVVVKENIRRAISEINAENKTTVILTTHDLDDIESLCKRIVMIDHGNKVYDGELLKLKKQYANFRELNFVLENGQSMMQIPATSDSPLHKESVIINENTGMVNIKFDNNITSVQDLLQYTLAHIKVKDVSIKEVNVEEIIRHIYTNEVNIDAKEA